MKQSIINWISPKDKLPGDESTPETEVIICFNGSKGDELVSAAMFFRGQFMWENYEEIEAEILYWAELPEPPSELQDKEFNKVHIVDEIDLKTGEVIRKYKPDDTEK